MNRDKWMLTHTKSRILIQLCMCILVLTSLQCNRGGGGAKHDNSTITVLYSGDEYFFNPLSGEDVGPLVFLPLYIHDENGELQPKLAERREHSPDYRTWTIHLRRDVRWHDGTPVTAHDIKFSMELWAHPEIMMTAPGDTIKVLDDFTLEVVNKKPSRDILNEWQVFYPKHLLEHLDPKEVGKWEFWTHPVGNGPYRYVRHVPKIMMEFEANPDYFLGKPKIEHVIIKFGGSSELTELLSGNVDITGLADRMDVLKLKDDPRYTVYQWANPSVYLSIHWNHRHPFFSDPVIRRALTLAINRDELHQALSIPETVPILDVTFSERQFRLDEIPAPLPFNPKQASQLLEEAGWHDIDGDGIRERDGEEFRFSMLVSHRDFFGEKTAVYIQEQLRRVGVRIEITTLFAMLLYKQLMKGDFDSVIYLFYNFPGNTLSYSAIGYDNPRIFQLHKSAEITMDLDKLDNIYRELMAIHSEEIPVTFLYPYLGSFVARKSIRGLSSPFRVDPIINMEHLWIEEEK